MSFQIGDAGHLTEHNSLRADIAAVAAARQVTVTLPDDAVLGDPGHVSDHNLLRQALADIAAAPGAGMPWAVISGGSSSTISDGGKEWRLCQFTTDGTLTVTQDGWLEVWAISGGAAGNGIDYQGGAGAVLSGVFYLPAGGYAVTVGAGGTAADRNGKPSSIGSALVTGMAPTYAGGPFSTPVGAGAQPGDLAREATSRITGAPLGYGVPASATPRANRGDGTLNGAGTAGVVIVRAQLGATPTLLPAPTPEQH